MTNLLFGFVTGAACGAVVATAWVWYRLSLSWWNDGFMTGVLATRDNEEATDDQYFDALFEKDEDSYYVEPAYPDDGE